MHSIWFILLALGLLGVVASFWLIALSGRASRRRGNIRRSLLLLAAAVALLISSSLLAHRADQHVYPTRTVSAALLRS
jgi:thiol:disulfide interchange protein